MRFPVDVIGLKLPAAARILDAAGLSYTTEYIGPLRGNVEQGIPRVIRQMEADGGKLLLTVCEVQEIGGADDR